MKNLIIFVSAVFMLSNTPLFSQQEISLPMMRHVWQSNYSNPSFLTDFEPTLGVFSGYQNILLPATYNDLVIEYTDDEGKEVRSIDGDQLFLRSEDENTILINLELGTLSGGFQWKGFHFGIHHVFKQNRYWNYSKQTLDLLWNGNAPYVGEEIPIELDMHITAYNEYGLGIARKFNNFSVGVRAKLLSGVGDISAVNNNGSLFTDNDIYQITLNSDYRLNSAGKLRMDSVSDIRTSITKYEPSDLLTNNLGVAFDFGFQWQVNEKLNLSASIVDWGGIKWKEDVRNYTSLGQYEYKGLNFDNVFGLDSLSIDQALDTLETIFSFEETEESYYSSLPLRLYIGGSFQLNENITLGGLFYSEFYRSKTIPAVAVNGSWKVADWLNLGMTYSWRNQRFDNVGLNAVAQFGPVQIYGATDNIVNSFRPYSTRSANIRAGLNVLFGKKKKGTDN